MTTNHKTMAEIRDEMFELEVEKATKCCQSCRDKIINSKIYFEYGFDCRDHLENEALKIAVEQIEGVILALVQHGQNINPGFLIEHLRKQLAEIRKLQGNQ